MANKEITIECTPGLPWLAVQLLINGQQMQPHVRINTVTGLCTTTVPEHTLCTVSVSALGNDGQNIKVILKLGDDEISPQYSQIQSGAPVNFFISFML